MDRSVTEAVRGRRLRRFLWVAALALLVLGALFVLLRGWNWLRAPRPNLVLITLDTLRADHLGCYGDTRAQTPRLDAFAEESIVFTRALSTINTTLASHAAMLTGRFPHSLGVPRNAFPLPEDVPLLQERLRERGYTTAAFVSTLALHSRMGLARGFEHYDEEYEEHANRQHQRRAAATTGAALAWLGEEPPEPFFLWVHYYDPHYPYAPPAPFDTLFGADYRGAADGSMAYLQRLWGHTGPLLEPSARDLQHLVDLYDGEIAYLDQELGPLLDWLAGPAMRARTCVLITADHGESLTEHHYLFNHGRHVYQPNMHVPLMVRLPAERAAEGRRIDAVVQTHSVCPTLLAVAGLDPLAGCVAPDLGPLLRGERVEIERTAWGEASQPWDVEQRDPEVYQNLSKAQMVVDWPWKLITTPFRNMVELYDLERDPHELTNVAPAERERTAALQAALARWREAPLRRGTRLDEAVLHRLRSLGYLE